MGHFSANSSSQNLHTFLLQFLQFVVALVGVCALTVDRIVWWRDHKFITLIQPSSAAAERVFSLLANSFNNNQESALKDYIQTSVMIQYNHR